MVDSMVHKALQMSKVNTAVSLCWARWCFDSSRALKSSNISRLEVIRYAQEQQMQLAVNIESFN